MLLKVFVCCIIIVTLTSVECQTEVTWSAVEERISLLEARDLNSVCLQYWK